MLLFKITQNMFEIYIFSKIPYIQYLFSRTIMSDKTIIYTNSGVNRIEYSWNKKYCFWLHALLYTVLA